MQLLFKCPLLVYDGIALQFTAMSFAQRLSPVNAPSPFESAKGIQ